MDNEIIVNVKEKPKKETKIWITTKEKCESNGDLLITIHKDSQTSYQAMNMTLTQFKEAQLKMKISKEK